MRAANMQALTDAAKRRYPGIVIYGIGDAAHKLNVSDHNEDDTPGSKAAQSDKDNIPEHRAIDLMLGKSFSKADADALVDRLLADSAARARMYYIIWNGYIWSRSNGWKKTKYNGSDQHRDHVHISGWAADDENAAGWPAVDGGTGGVEDLFCKKGDQGLVVKALQVRLKNLGFDIGKAGVDGVYGDSTQKALRAASLKANPSTGALGDVYDHNTMFYVDRLMIEAYGGKGAKGDKGDPGKDGKDGKDGRDGILRLPDVVTIQAKVQPQ